MLSLRKLEEASHGFEIGRLALAPEAFLEDVPRLEASLAVAAAAPSSSSGAASCAATIHGCTTASAS
jgi:hypothetical protein